MFRIRDNVYCDVCGNFGEKWANYDFSALDEADFESVSYRLVDKEEYENELIQLLGGMDEGSSDFSLIKTNLKRLLRCEDEVIFLSLGDNEFLIESECDELEAFHRKEGYQIAYNAFNQTLTKFIEILKEKKEKK